MQFVDDVEFWFPPGNKPIVQYRSASRSGFIDFSANKKRVKVKLFTCLNETLVILYIVHDMIIDPCYTPGAEIGIGEEGLGIRKQLLKSNKGVN
jgi:hypothetical protein